MKEQFRAIGILALNLLLLQTAFANQVVVNNVTLTGQNIANRTTLVQFDISWRNSWLVSVGPSNWDAAWVFVKYSVSGGPWMHATLATSGHTAPSGSTIDTPSDGKGVFIYRSSDGTGSVEFTGVQLKWEYGADNVADNAIVDVKVFAIEMVLVPTAEFAAGSGGTGDGHFFEGGGNNPFQITSEGAITVGNSSGQLFYNSPGSLYGDQTGPIPAAFPNGYSAFYCMKYEISQEQYADFLNCLTSTQAATRNPGQSTFRYSITGSHPNFSSSKPFVACNFLSWIDGCAYADWAGLRPMTELEFEKACRGNQPPAADEFAWGNTNITAANGISNDGAANEVPSNAGANCVFGNSGTGGAMRVGCFATSTSTREQAGASFYGILELSGNLWERPVSIGNFAGRNFTGTLGDGSLSTNGNATNSDWPGFAAGEVTGASGSGLRGGDWINVVTAARVSDRHSAAFTLTTRSGILGFRCVRPVP